jgi:hypothetical protein
MYRLSEVEAARLKRRIEKEQTVFKNTEELDLDPVPIEGLT